MTLKLQAHDITDSLFIQEFSIVEIKTIMYTACNSSKLAFSIF